MTSVGLTEMVVESVRVHMLSSQHVVILKEAERDRYLPIWIGPWEANAIAMKLQGVSPERPLTHDLFAQTLEQLGVAVQRVVISDLADETYRARLVLELDGEIREIDARPSDSIALAVRASVPIYATDAVLDRAGVIPETDEDEKLSVFREFVNSLEVELGGSVEGSEEPPQEPDIRRLDDQRLVPSTARLVRPGRLAADQTSGRTGAPRRMAVRRFAHIRRRSDQKSRMARATTRGSAPEAWPAVRGWWGTPTSTTVRPVARSLMSSSAERKAPLDSRWMPVSAVRRKSLQAQSTSRSLSPKKMRRASRYSRA